ncbi:DUF86 domain-containing protein [Sporolactobacillus spathodeae]|nr:DUF86 domain-containing protein [Sporolactobacillus spathodeae]
MYFVDRQQLTDKLDYMDRLLRLFQDQAWDTELKHLALERIVQNLIESIIDVGNQMIDGFIMRDPGGYLDIIDILQDESVLPEEEAVRIKNVVAWRKQLVRNYLGLDHKQLAAIVSENQSALSGFSKRVNDYLEKELGPVSAFAPNKNRV